MDQWNFVMHPVFAAKSCDPDGAYVRQWMPLLAGLPVEYIHCPWEAPFAMRATARVVLGGVTDRSYPKRVVVDLEAARRRSHEAVMAVRRGPGAAHVLPSGHEALALDDGRPVVLITREDYREGRITTRQTADAKWDASKRPRQDGLSCVMRDCERAPAGWVHSAEADV